MGHRISRVVTRTGDDGFTSLGPGPRRAKFDPRISAIGDVDELNCQLGLLLCQPLPEDMRAPLAALQHRLFDLGGELAMPEARLVQPAHLSDIDLWLESWNTTLPPLKEFVIPGGHPACAQAHVCRAVARRAERALWALHAVEPLPELLPQLMNRLSDLLFVASRRIARELGADELPWQRTPTTDRPD